MAKNPSWFAVIAEEVRSVKSDKRSLRKFGFTMGIALAGLCRNADAAAAAGLAVALPMQFLCGTLFPLEAMPPVLRHIAEVLPLTYFVNAFRGAVLFGGGPADYAKDWLVLLGCLAVAFLVGPGGSYITGTVLNVSGGLYI